MVSMDAGIKSLVAEKAMAIRYQLMHMADMDDGEIDPIMLRIEDLAVAVYEEALSKATVSVDNSLQVIRALDNERNAIVNALEGAFSRADAEAIKTNTYKNGLSEAIHIITARLSNVPSAPVKRRKRGLG